MTRELEGIDPNTDEVTAVIWCDECGAVHRPPFYDAEAPPNWVESYDNANCQRHLCPKCAMKGIVATHQGGTRP